MSAPEKTGVIGTASPTDELPIEWPNIGLRMRSLIFGVTKPGGSKYEAWQAGDKALDAERLRLARILHPGKASIG